MRLPRLSRPLVVYFVASSILIHAALAGLAIVYFDRLEYQLRRGARYAYYTLFPRPEPLREVTAADLRDIVPHFRPKKLGLVQPGEIGIGNERFRSLKAAAYNLKDGDRMVIGSGTYEQAFTVAANNVEIVGDGHVILERATVQGKGAIVVNGEWTTIRNIECRRIKVRDGNGACVRLQGKNLLLDHVYFHNSQQGMLAGGKDHGFVEIRHSRFERLGGGRGQSHGVYIGGGELSIIDSYFIRSKNEGHEIKSRASSTSVLRSVVASLDGDSSRLLDIPNGGNLTVRDSVLAQGPKAVNQDVIGYGLEGVTHPPGQVIIENNLILMERPKGNELFHRRGEVEAVSLRSNLIVTDSEPSEFAQNTFYESRKAAGLPPYPFLPKSNSLGR